MVANTILEQLGGNKFIACTGSKNFISDGNSLRMMLVKNKSTANYLTITLNGLDSYDMEFCRIIEPKFNLKTGEMRKFENIKITSLKGVMFDQLQSFFTSVTDLDTHL